MIYLGNGYAHIFSNSKNKGNRNSNNLGQKVLPVLTKDFIQNLFSSLTAKTVWFLFTLTSHK